MASTDNLNLYLPTREDYISVTRDISQNMQKIDDGYGVHSDTLTGIESGIAIIANGDTHVAISAGQFVYVLNNTHGLTEGMYKATGNIAANATISSSNVTSAPNCLNTLLNKVKTITAENLSTYTGASLVQAVKTAGESIRITAASGSNGVSDLPIFQAGTYIIMPDSYYADIIFIGTNGASYFHKYDSNTWVQITELPIDVTLTVDPTKISSGTVKCKKIGNIAFVEFNAVVFESEGDSQSSIVTGLPKAIQQASFTGFCGANASETSQIANSGNAVWVPSNSTTMSAHIGSAYNLRHWGTMVYPCI